MDVLEALTFCLERGIAFYVYRLPGENKFCFGAQVDGAVGCWENVKDLEGLDGFVAVPFREDEGVEPLFVRGDVVFEGMTEDGEMLARLQRAKSQKVEYLKPMEGVNREEYLKQAGRMIDALQQKEARKAVLARGIVVETEAFRWASQWFEALALCYPDAFVFVVSVPSKMTWMGATPEILLKQGDQGVVTMSLAGTRKVGSAGEWGDKEQEEQRIVTEYITRNLSSSMASLQRFIIWKQSSVRVAFGKAVCTMTAIVSERSAVTSLTLNRSFSGIWSRIVSTSSAMAVLVRQEREQVVLEGGLVNAQTLAHVVGQQHPVLCVSPLSPLPEPAQRVLVTTLKVVSVSEIVLTKATCCHRGRIQVFFFRNSANATEYRVPSATSG